MTLPEKLLTVKDQVDDDVNDSVVLYALGVAKEAIVKKAFPFEPDAEVPDNCAMRQCEIAVYLVNKRGAEGEVSHSEPGSSRTYESASVPESMLKGIVPRCKVVSG